MKKRIPKPVQNIQKKTQEQTVSQRERKNRISYSKIFLSVCTLLGILLAFFAKQYPYFPIDLKITRSIQTIHNPLFNMIMQWVSAIGFPPQVYGLIIILVALLYLAGLRWEATVALLDGIGVTLFNGIIKTLVHRERPSIDLVRVVKHLGEYSFPSGHVMFYMGFFGYLFFLTYILIKPKGLRLSLMLILGSIILAIAPSRVYLGAHWASDVFGAYLFGAIWLTLTIYFYEWGKTRFFRRQPTASSK